MSVSPSAFTCSEIGDNTVILTVIDNNGNESTITSTVTVEDNVAAEAKAKDITVQLDGTGTVSITAADVDNGSNDACGIKSMSVSPSAFTCSEIGDNTVILTVIDNNGNESTTTSIVTVEDNEAPIITCPGDISQDNDPGVCGAMVTYAVPLVTDNCENQQPVKTNFTSLGSLNNKFYYLSNNYFSPISAYFHARGSGGNLVTINDASENDFISTSLSGVNAMIGFTKWLAEGEFIWFNGEAITYTNWSAGEPDNAGGWEDFAEILSDGTWNDFANDSAKRYILEVDIMRVTQTSGLPSGSKFPIGTTTNTFKVTDASGNTSNTCSFDVTVTDAEVPAAIAQDITVQLDASGMAAIDLEDVLAPLTDSYMVDQSGDFNPVDISGTGSDVLLDDDEVSDALPVGFSFNFYGIDYTNFYISSNGFITFNSDADDDWYEAMILPDIEMPNNLIAMAWSDINPEAGGTIRYSTTGTAPNRVLVVEFNEVPQYADNNPITTQVQLYEGTNLIEIHTTTMPSNSNDYTQGVENSDGTRAVTTPGRNAADWSATNDYVSFTPYTPISTDNCGIAGTTIDVSTFDCSDIGDNTVIVTVTDVNENIATFTAIVTVEDNIAPELTAEADQEVELDGSCSITIPDVMGTSTDNCMVSITQTPEVGTEIFSEHDGTVDVVVTATDAAGNTDEKTVVLTATDVTVPVLIAEADQDVNLDDSCSITVPDVMGTATDNCMVSSVIQIPEVGTILSSEHDGPVEVVVTATDAAGNIDLKTVILTATDVTAPLLTAESNQEVELDGSCSITIPDVMGTATDNCIVNITQVPEVGTILSSEHDGTVEVVVTAIDAAGNIDEKAVVLTSKDVTDPVLTAESNQVVELDDSCSITVPDVMGTATDNCTVNITQVPEVGTEISSEHDGTVEVVVTATDAAGNIDEKTVILTTKDVTAPKTDVAELDEITAECEVLEYDVTIPTATDNCVGLVSVSHDASFPITTQGLTVITWSFEDAHGNIAKQTQDVVIDDVTAPSADVTQLVNITAECEVLEADVPVPTATDNCGGVVSVSHDVSFPITTQGLTVITWSFEYVNGNIAKQTQDVMLEDMTAPVPDLLELEAIVESCEAINIEAPTATDNCGGTITGTTLDPISYVEEGEFMILWEFNDGNGNIIPQEQWVTVKDHTAPLVSAQDLTVTVDQDEPAVITPGQVNDASSDNCSEIVFTLDKDTFEKPGVYEVVLTGTDASGNTSQATATVTVKREGADPMEVHVVPTMLTRTSIAKVILPFRGRIMEVQVLEVETNNYKVFDGNKKNVMEIDVAPMKGTLLVKILDNEGNFHLTKLIAL